MTKAKQIKILTNALKWYKNTGTRVVMFDKNNKMFVENGIIAAEALFLAGVHKKIGKKKEYV